MEHSLTLLSDFAQAMGAASPKLAAKLRSEAEDLAHQYAGFKAGRGGLSFDRPILQADFEALPSLMLPLVANGLNAVRECSCCGELFVLSASGQKGPEICIHCKRAEQRDRKRRWRAETKVEVQPRRCVACGTEFTPKRADAKACSAKCRTKLSRAKQSTANLQAAG